MKQRLRLRHRFIGPQRLDDLDRASRCGPASSAAGETTRPLCADSIRDFVDRSGRAAITSNLPNVTMVSGGGGTRLEVIRAAVADRLDTSGESLSVR